MAFPNSLSEFLDNIPNFDESVISSGNNPMLPQVGEKAVGAQTATPVSYEDSLNPPLNDGIDILLSSSINANAALEFQQLGSPQINVLGPQVREMSWYEQGAVINDEAGRRDLTTSNQSFVPFKGPQPSVTPYPSTPTVDSFPVTSSAVSSSRQKLKRKLPKSKPKKKYESEDTGDKTVKNAKTAKLNRDKKKQQFVELQNENAKLKAILAAREPLSKEDTVEFLGMIVSAVKAVGCGHVVVIVLESLAKKHGHALSQQEIIEIANNADLSNRRQFRISTGLDAEGKLVVDVD